MGAAVFMILFWLGFRRFDVQRDEIVTRPRRVTYRPQNGRGFRTWLHTIIFLIFSVLFVPFVVNAQTTDDTVCISRAAAVKALEDSDARKALEAEAKVKDQAIADLKAEIANMRLEYVKAAAETTALKQQAVRDAAIIELLLKYARPKKVGLINLF